MFMLQSQKGLHLLQILTAGTTGVYAETMLSVPNPTQVVSMIQIGAQVLIAVVTAWAALRKAFQKPVVTVPAPPQDVQTFIDAE